MQNVGHWADRIKLLWWDGTGVCLLSKRLEDGQFRWPRIEDGVMRLSGAQLWALLEGLDWRRVHESRRTRVPAAGGQGRRKPSACRAAATRPTLDGATTGWLSSSQRISRRRRLEHWIHWRFSDQRRQDRSARRRESQSEQPHTPRRWRRFYLAVQKTVSKTGKTDLTKAPSLSRNLNHLA